MNASDLLFVLLIAISGTIFIVNCKILADSDLEDSQKTVAINGVMYFWNVIIKYVFCSLIGIAVRFLQDRKNNPKPDWAFQIVAGFALSYLAYILYNYYKWSFMPLEFFICIVSWLATSIVTSADTIAKNGIVIYLRKIATDFLAFTKKKES